MRMLTLYSGGVPNTADTLYIYDTSVSGYRYQVGLYIGSGLEIAPDKYQISINLLTIADDPRFYETSYIIEYDTADTNYIRCYFVQNKIIRSGAIFFTLLLDYFGTYISRMTYNFFTCERTNGVTLASYIQGGNANPSARTITPFKAATFSKWTDSLVVLLYASIKRTDPFSQPIINTFPIAFTLKDLKDALDVAYGSSFDTSKTITYVLTEVLGGVTGIDYSIPGLPVYQVTINKVYVIPKEFINFGTSYFEDVIVLQSQTNLVANQLNILGHILDTQTKTLSLQVPSPQLANKNYIGTFSNNIEIDNFVSRSAHAFVITAVSKNDLSIEINYGDAQKDLTSSFAWTITNNNLQADSLNRMTNFIGLLASGATAIGGAVTGNPLAAVGGGASFVSSLSSTINYRNQKPPKNNSNTSGDLALYYKQEPHEALSYPIVMISYETLDNTEIEVNLNGAPCADTSRNVYDFINSQLIFANAYVNYRFIRGHFTDMKGIPTTAVSEIQSAFNSGIRVFKP